MLEPLSQNTKNLGEHQVRLGVDGSEKPKWTSLPLVEDSKPRAGTLDFCLLTLWCR